MTDKPVAIVTGAVRGIGRASAIRLSQSGYHIAALDLDLTQAADFQAEIESNAAACQLIRMDIAELDRHAEILDQIMDRFGRIDFLLNNAGTAPLERRDVLETTPDSYDRVMSINLRGAFFLTQKVSRIMLKLRSELRDYSPRIVFITSISADVSSPSRAEYCISKAGLSMTSKIFADRLASSDIGVFEIRPGIIKTDMTASVKDKYDKLIAEGLIPQGRWGTADDVAKVVAAVSRGDFDYSSGMRFEVSGGMNIQNL